MFRDFKRKRTVRFHFKDGTTAEGVLLRANRREYVCAAGKLEVVSGQSFVDLDGTVVLQRADVKVLQVL